MYLICSTDPDQPYIRNSARLVIHDLKDAEEAVFLVYSAVFHCEPKEVMIEKIFENAARGEIIYRVRHDYEYAGEIRKSLRDYCVQHLSTLEEAKNFKDATMGLDKK